MNKKYDPIKKDFSGHPWKLGDKRKHYIFKKFHIDINKFNNSMHGLC